MVTYGDIQWLVMVFSCPWERANLEVGYNWKIFTMFVPRDVNYGWMCNWGSWDSSPWIMVSSPITMV